MQKKSIFLFLASTLVIVEVCGLRDVSVTVPLAVTPGDTVTLKCSYDLEGDSLYTVKWYKGRQEFFRYVPKELPHTRVFPLPGVDVDVSLSGANEVVLRDVQMDLAGKYRCEVSADAPYFLTEVVSSHMHVAYMPHGDPVIKVEKNRYTVGDTLRGNCTSPPSNPPTNLTWLLNGKNGRPDIRNTSQRPVIPEEHILCDTINASFSLKRSVDAGNNTRLVVTVIGVELDMDSAIFQYGRVELQCVATMFHLYRGENQITLEEERPRLASVLGTRESSLGAVKRVGNYWVVFLLAVCLCVTNLSLPRYIVRR